METKEVIIIGTGYSGICMAIKLKQAGMNNFTIIEKEKELGGTWYINSYPGAQCDVESHLYSFSFESYDWTKVFPDQPELNNYIKHCAKKYDIESHIKLGTTVIGAEYNDDEGTWEIDTQESGKFKTKFLIAATGGLNIPSYPDFKGIENFEGETFHSARWKHNINLKGKNVAVIGSAASAIQFIPEIAPIVKNLELFQRTANWILPKPDRPFKPWERKLFKTIPFTHWLYREKLYWLKELRVIAFTKYPNLLKMVSQGTVKYLTKTIKDPQKLKALIPNYTMGCKRILISNFYYKAIVRENVHMITDGVAQVNKNSITTTAGKEIPVDVIIYSTGFKATNPYAAVKIVGSKGLLLSSVIAKKGISGHLGTTMTGFPNLFIMTGPNTGIGHTSLIHLIESQANYVMDGLKYIKKNGVKSFEVKEEAQNKFNEGLTKKMENTVWLKGGCESWYKDEFGRVPTLWPDFTFNFRKMTKHFDYKNYKILTK